MDEYSEPYADEALRLACKDLDTGCEGQLVVDDEKMHLSLFSFQGRQEDRERIDRTLKLENGKYASLFRCVPAGSVTFGGIGIAVTSRQDTISNLTIVGPRPWQAAGLVRRMGYSFVGASVAIAYSDHINSEFKKLEADSYVDIDTVRYDKSEVLAIDTRDVVVKIRMSIQRTIGLPDPGTRSTPVVVIEFKRDMTIDEALLFGQGILEFFELSIGVKTRMLKVTVSPMTEAEFRRAIESKKVVEEFSVRRAFGGWRPSSEKGHRGDVFFPATTESARKRTKESLVRWIERIPVWGRAYALGSGYIQGPEVYGRDRLLRLMSWFESIPDYQMSSSISSSNVRDLARAAAARAAEQQVEISLQRICEVLSGLRRLSLRERVASAISDLRKKFGVTVIASSLDRDCQLAVKFRNQAAHGHFDGDQNFSDFYRSIRAMELVCALSSVSGLDFDERRLSEIYDHPLLRYRPTFGAEAF